VFSNKNVGIAVTAVAVLAGLMMGVAGPGRAQDTKAPDKAPAPQMTAPEYAIADPASKEQDPAKRLVLLKDWKAKFPQTEFANTRQDMFLAAYMQLNQPREAFDQALDILKDRPKDYPSILATVQMATKIMPAPTPQDLDIGEKNANLLIDNPDSIKPAAATDEQWAANKAQIKPYAENVLLSIYTLRKDDKRAVDDLRKLIQRDPGFAMASYRLGQAMVRILQADKKPEEAPPAFFQIARALSVTGPNAIPDAQKPAILTYLQGQYKNYHGSMDGFDDLMTQAKATPFPPVGFGIKSNVDIANEQEAARIAEVAKDPIMYTWVHTIKDGLATKGDSFWNDVVKDAGLPGPAQGDATNTPQFFKATIISISPNPKPKEIVVGIEKPDVADAKLVFEKPLEGKMEPGEKIEFWGAAKEWTKDPNIMITFDVADPKTDLKGWTGKNPAAGRGAVGAKGTGASKAGTASKGTAAPKQ
jgi:hypothetical protein